MDLSQENAGASLPDIRKNERDPRKGDKSFSSMTLGLDVSPLSSLQAFLEKKGLWWCPEGSLLSSLVARIADNPFVSSLSSIFHRYRPRDSFPYSPKRPLRLELRLFSRRHISGEVLREGESQGRWRVADDGMPVRNPSPGKGQKYKQDIGILIRYVIDRHRQGKRAYEVLFLIKSVLVLCWDGILFCSFFFLIGAMVFHVVCPVLSFLVSLHRYSMNRRR